MRGDGVIVGAVRVSSLGGSRQGMAASMANTLVVGEGVKWGKLSTRPGGHERGKKTPGGQAKESPFIKHEGVGV